MTMLAPAPRDLDGPQTPVVRWTSIARATWLMERTWLLVLALVELGLAVTTMIGALALQSPEWLLTDLEVAAYVLPVLIGMFLGAPLLARELETGTYRFTWTQSVTRARHVTVTLAVLVSPVALSGCLLGLLLSWYAHPLLIVRLASRWQPALFDAAPLTLAAWSALALMLGALLGALIRNAAAAVAATAAVVGGFLLAAYAALVARLLTIGAIVSTHVYVALEGPIHMPAPAGDPLPGSWYVRAAFLHSDGAPVPMSTVFNLEARVNAATGHASATAWNPAVIGWLSRHGFSYQLTYQPPGHFAYLQLVAFSVLILVAAALFGLLLGAISPRRVS